MPHATAVALNTEWEHLATQDVSCWAQPLSQYCAAQVADDLLHAVHHSPNAAIPFLIQQCQEGNQLAGRIIVQAMLGKLILTCNRGRARQIPTNLDDMVTTLWLVIATFPLSSSSTTNFAARLALDTLKRTQAFWDHDLTRPIPDEVAWKLVEDHTWREEETPIAHPDEVIDMAVGYGWLNDSEAQVMTALYSNQLSTTKAAQALQLSPATTFRRRRSGLDALHKHAHELLAM